MRVKIISEDGLSSNAALMLENGMPLDNVAEVAIWLRPGSPVEARLTFLLSGVNAVAAATVSEAHLRELAESHGYSLTKKVPQ